MSKLNLAGLLFTLQMFAVYPSASNASQTVDGQHTIVLDAISHFVAVKGQTNRWYVDKQRMSLAVDASQFKEQFANVQTAFKGGPGEYRLILTSLVEVDGESEYRLSVNNKPVGSATNPEANIDFGAVNHNLGNVTLTPGDVIAIAFNSATNGKIPEGDSTAYARGRWTKLTLECISCE